MAYFWLRSLFPSSRIIKIDNGADFLVIRHRPSVWKFFEVKTGPYAAPSEYQERVQQTVGDNHYEYLFKNPDFCAYYQLKLTEQQGEEIIRQFVRKYSLHMTRLGERFHDALGAQREFGLVS